MYGTNFSSRKKTMLVFGRITNMPFGTVRNEKKLEIEREIKRSYENTINRHC